jgi:HPt (histidine-containing phosphotransfer) domain-containing protein
MPAPAINPATISNLRALGGKDPGFLREIITIFLSDMPARIAELEAGLAAGETEKFVRAAHSIKGSAANLGATRLQGAAEHLENRTLQPGTALTARLLAEIIGEFARARRELERLLEAERA